MATFQLSDKTLEQLAELAEWSLHTQFQEFSNPPSDEDRQLMLLVWTMLSKDVPPFFARQFGWNHTSNKP